MLQVLDQHISQLRVQNQQNEIASRRQFFIYEWEAFDATAGDTTKGFQEKLLTLQEDAAFVADAVMVQAGQADTPDEAGVDRIEIRDLYTGRSLTEGLSSSKDQLSSIPFQFFPNSAPPGYAPYCWYELPSEFLIPRGGTLAARVEIQLGQTASVRLALRGYKVFQE
jgi:hypothetical protein